jgi:hypothetical protein
VGFKVPNFGERPIYSIGVYPTQTIERGSLTTNHNEGYNEKEYLADSPHTQSFFVQLNDRTWQL